ncbi:MAG: ABC transporter permease, partial [Holosporaceae bacterium]|nr:ABC transporter permease [Holosporaceae bacterium]
MILLGFLWKEALQLFRNKKLLYFEFCFPIIQLLLISLAINNEPQNLRLLIDCKPNDYLMAEMRDAAVSSGRFVICENTGERPFDAILSNKADAAIIAPEGGFTKSVGGGHPKLQVLADATNMLKAQAIEAYLKAIASSVMGKSEPVTVVKKPAIDIKTRILFNPEMKTRSFLIPFLMCMIITIMLLSLVAISIVREKECGTIEMLISAPIKKIHIILGKSIPYIAVCFVNVLTLLGVAVFVLQVPFRSSLCTFLLSFANFAFVITSCAVLLSTFCKTQQQAMLGLVIFLFLSVMLSGGVYPIENMPKILQIIANALPLSHLTFLARNIFLKGCDVSYFLQHNLAML